jgi:hypothetical protein
MPNRGGRNRLGGAIIDTDDLAHRMSQLHAGGKILAAFAVNGDDDIDGGAPSPFLRIICDANVFGVPRDRKLQLEASRRKTL